MSSIIKIIDSKFYDIEAVYLNGVIKTVQLRISPNFSPLKLKNLTEPEEL